MFDLNSSICLWQIVMCTRLTLQRPLIDLSVDDLFRVPLLLSSGFSFCIIRPLFWTVLGFSVWILFLFVCPIGLPSCFRPSVLDIDHQRFSQHQMQVRVESQISRMVQPKQQFRLRIEIHHDCYANWRYSNQKCRRYILYRTSSVWQLKKQYYQGRT